MKAIIKAHVVTAIVGWIFILIGAGIVIKEERSLPAVLSLCLVGVVTVITIVDLLSVYIAKKQTPVLPVISIIFWGTLIIIYGWSMLSPNEPWQGRVVYSVLILTSIFKIIASVSIIKMQPSTANS